MFKNETLLNIISGYGQYDQCKKCPETGEVYKDFSTENWKTADPPPFNNFFENFGNNTWNSLGHGPKL